MANSIAAITVYDRCIYTPITSLNNLSGDGLVDADGYVIPGSAADGTGIPFLVGPSLCAYNIGWDQPEPCPYVYGDLTGDGLVDGADLGVLLAAWGQDEPAVDFTGDGLIDGADLGSLLAYWGNSTP